jgi:phosphatidyl-myo-inositol dimannoside synthase
MTDVADAPRFTNFLRPPAMTGPSHTQLPVSPLPHVLTVHGGDIFGLRGKLMGWFKRFALHGADAVTVNTSVTRQAVLETADPLPQLETIPTGVSVAPANPQQQDLARKLRAAHRRGAGPLLLFIGRIVEEKGVADLVQAVRLLRETHPDVHALIVGEGQERAEMERLAAQAGVAANITFTGWVEPTNIAAYLRAADIFVGPSRIAPDGWVEAQGLTFLEAMAAGMPVIATRCGGIVDSVVHDETGLLCGQRDVSGIAAAVVRIMNEPGLRRRLTSNADHVVRQQFSRATSATEFANLFAKLVR